MQMPPLGQTLQPGRDIHPVAIDLLALDHHVAKIDADAELHTPLGWQVSILGFERGLDIGCTLHCIDHAGEFGQHAVAGGIDKPSAMLLDERIDNFAIGSEGD
jgi:hypothetical protein